MNVGISDDSMSQATKNKEPSKNCSQLDCGTGFSVFWRHGLLRGCVSASTRDEPCCGIKYSTYPPADRTTYVNCAGNAGGKERDVIDVDDNQSGNGPG